MKITQWFPSLTGLVVLSFLILSAPDLVWNQIPVHSPDINQRLLNEPIDISNDFRNFSNTYYLADSLSEFNPETGEGKIVYRRYEYVTRQAFNNMLGVLQRVRPNEFPSGEYAVSPELPLSISFRSP
jgi:alpha-D-xyloside xylohydrolase